jgi:iron complex outermembrane receptor protein
LSPAVIANSLFDFTWKGFSANLLSQYVGRQYLDNTSNQERSIDPYFVSNVRIGYVFKPTFVKELGIDLTVNNLFNEAYETGGFVYSYIEGGKSQKEDGYFTQAGTHALVRVTIRF